MNDTEKIEAIKKLVASTKLNTIENCLETLSDIIHIVYGVDKKEKIMPQKQLLV